MREYIAADKSRGPQRLVDVVNRTARNGNFDTHLVWYGHFIIAKYEFVAGTSLDLGAIIIIGQTYILRLRPVGEFVVLVTIAFV